MKPLGDLFHTPRSIHYLICGVEHGTTILQAVPDHKVLSAKSLQNAKIPPRSGHSSPQTSDKAPCNLLDQTIQNFLIERSQEHCQHFSVIVKHSLNVNLCSELTRSLNWSIFVRLSVLGHHIIFKLSMAKLQLSQLLGRRKVRSGVKHLSKR